MTTDTERFIELAIRPLDDNAELLLSAEAELRKSIEAHTADRPAALSEALESLVCADRHPKWRHWRLVIYVLTLLVSIPLLVHTVKQMIDIRGAMRLISSMSGGGFSPTEIPNLTPEQKLLLYGDTFAVNRSDRWKPLWEKHPENPAYLAEYAAAYHKDHDELSPEILAAVEKIDADNGWFTALVAGGVADGVVTQGKRSAKESKDGKAAVMTIHDEVRLQESLALLHQIAGKPRFTSYQADLVRQRIPLFPSRRDFVSQIPLMAYTASLPSSTIGFRKFADLFAAGAQQCAAKGDVEGFRRIVSDWKALVTLSIRGGDTLVDLLIAKVSISRPAPNFRDAALSLGLEDEARYFSDLDERARRENGERNKATASPTEALFEKRASILTRLMLPVFGRQVKSPPILTDHELRPARYSEHALFERCFSLLGWTLIGACAGLVALSRLCPSHLARNLSSRMQALLRPSDWTWLLLGGIVFPLLWYFFVTRLTPWSGREWSPRLSGFFQQGGQFGSMVLSMIVLPQIIASWRLAKRGAALGLKAPFPWMGWVVGLSTLVAIPAFGAITLGPPLGRVFQIIAVAVSGISAIWIFAGLLLHFLGRETQALRRATLARIVAPVWVFGMLVLAALVPFFYAEEQRWIKQDRLTEISADAPSMSRYEYEVTQILRSELLEMIGETENTQ
jgi:hypothetical protein